MKKQQLADKGPFTITTLEAALLLLHLTKASETKEVGFEDIDHTLLALREALKSEVEVPQEVLESCLWSANLMGEIGEFWHPDGYSHKEFIDGIVGSHNEFDYFYNYIRERKAVPDVEGESPNGV